MEFEQKSQQESDQDKLAKYKEHLRNLYVSFDRSVSQRNAAMELLRVARCPDCDGSGIIQTAVTLNTSMHDYASIGMAIDSGFAGMPVFDDGFNCTQCKWCAKRNALIDELAS